jgi:hypothetical protein
MVGSKRANFRHQVAKLGRCHMTECNSPLAALQSHFCRQGCGHIGEIVRREGFSLYQNASALPSIPHQHHQRWHISIELYTIINHKSHQLTNLDRDLFRLSRCINRIIRESSAANPKCKTSQPPKQAQRTTDDLPSPLPRNFYRPSPPPDPPSSLQSLGPNYVSDMRTGVKVLSYLAIARSSSRGSTGVVSAATHSGNLNLVFF